MARPDGNANSEFSQVFQGEELLLRLWTAPTFEGSVFGNFWTIGGRAPTLATYRTAPSPPRGPLRSPLRETGLHANTCRLFTHLCYGERGLAFFEHPSVPLGDVLLPLHFALPLAQLGQMSCDLVVLRTKRASGRGVRRGGGGRKQGVGVGHPRCAHDNLNLTCARSGSSVHHFDQISKKRGQAGHGVLASRLVS